MFVDDGGIPRWHFAPLFAYLLHVLFQVRLWFVFSTWTCLINYVFFPRPFGWWVSCFLFLLCLRPLILLTFDLLDFLWFILIGFGRLVWWLVVGLLFNDDVVVLNSLNLIWWGCFCFFPFGVSFDTWPCNYWIFLPPIIYIDGIMIFEGTWNIITLLTNLVFTIVFNFLMGDSKLRHALCLSLPLLLNFLIHVRIFYNVDWVASKLTSLKRTNFFISL